MHKQYKNNPQLLLPSIIAAGFIPLIMHVFYYDCGLSQFDWFPDNASQMSDYFLGWKMVAIIITGIVMVLILVVKYYRNLNKFVLNNAFYALLIYALFVAMSAVFSKYKHWVGMGSHAMFESVWVLFSYLIFCVYTYVNVNNEKQVCTLLKGIGIGAFIVMLIGSFQFWGFDFFDTTFGRMLVTNPDSWANKTAFHINVPKHTVYTTLYNQNYLSFYSGLAIPVILGLFFTVRKQSERIVLAIMEILAITCLIGAQSASGWIALCAAFIICGFVLLSRKKKTLLAGAVTGGLLVVIGLILCLATPLGDKVSALFFGTSEFPSLKAIDTTGDCIRMDINGHTLQIVYTYDEVSGQVAVETMDENNTTLPTQADDATTVTLTDPDYLNCKVAVVMYNEQIAVQVTLEDHDWLFLQNDSGQYMLINQAGKEEVYKSPKFSTLFKNDAFSGRGHIWDGIIPILPKYLFMGSGANTFLFAYPQNDYIYRTYLNTQNVLDVKPHNMYLQQWIENGMIAMLAFLIFYFWYIISSIKLYRRVDLSRNLAKIGFGIFTGVICYLLVGLVNDSNVCTAPVFWVILGLGMAINRILKEHDVVISNIFKKDEEQEQLPSNTIAPQKSLNKKSSRKARKKH